MLKFPKVEFDRFLANAKKNAPDEACALLGGIVNGQDAEIKRVFLLTNVDHSPEHFSMDPAEQFAVIKKIRQKKWTLLGNLHSHPASPSRPSEEDKRLAFDPSLRYLILSLMKEEPVVKCFHIHGTEVEEESITLREE